MMKLKLNERIFLILTCNNSEHQSLVEQCWLRYKEEFHRSIKTNGPRWTLARYKSAYRYVSHHYLRLPQTPIPFMKTNRSGFPKILLPLRPIMFEENEKINRRIVMAIARIFQTIRLPIEPELHKITDPGEVLSPQMIRSFTKFVELWVKRVLHKGYGPLTNSRAIHSMKSGPNGQALTYASLDAAAVSQDVKMWHSITSLNTLLGNEWVNKMLLSNTPDEQMKDVIHSKLGFSAEGGGKTRTFAICDYWSQLTLKPIHSALLRILKKLVTDATYDQTRGFNRILKESLGKETFCFDLSGASDRIPLRLQEIIITSIFGREISHHWSTIIADREFQSKFGAIRWTVGQPLGLLSSWGSFALWHHIHIEYLANSIGIHSFREYQVLGDDVVIWNSDVAALYRTSLHEIGIPINMEKSLHGDSQHSQIEFAKRHAISGEEISGLSYLLLDTDKISQVSELIQVMNERNLVNEDRCFKLVPHPHKGFRERLNFLIWFTLDVSSDQKAGLLTIPVTEDQISKLVIEIRRNRIKDKVMNVEERIKRFIPLDELFLIHRLPYNETALGLTGHDDEDLLHPVVRVSVEIGINLQELYFKFLMNEITDDMIDDLEYLPSTPNREFFYNSKTARKEFYSTVVLDAYAQVKLLQQTEVEG